MLLGGLALAAMQLALRARRGLSLPKTVSKPASAFSIQSPGSGKATLYIVGPGRC